MFGSLFELKNANLGIFLQPKLGNQGPLLYIIYMQSGHFFLQLLNKQRIFDVFFFFFAVATSENTSLGVHE